ncbi:hypothetical protein Ari01nite_59900 [Paractinoplanes rishiriensis]|uniref:Uncharacterized protein n=1 Tax=Paractinoplanes rishiriensis TaxID=1050105 RepID=A0A919MZM9_9ACTN|nr:hypothetical protein Ari01nite_59900 [Actinoplanes rishiriensis]
MPDLFDHVLDDMSVGADAMRWAPDRVVPDLRLLFHREWPAHRQATWRWWCEICRQPLPQPHWLARSGPDGEVILLAYHQTVDPRQPRHPVIERPSGTAAAPHRTAW